ncbi:hypothetical protein Tco_0651219 [Tanacetum coccineum]
MKIKLYVEDQGNEADRDTNANLEGRDDVKTDVVLPQVQATQEIEDTHVTLTLINPDGQQQSSSVLSGFVSNMLNPNQDTDVFEAPAHQEFETGVHDEQTEEEVHPLPDWESHIGARSEDNSIALRPQGTHSIGDVTQKEELNCLVTKVGNSRMAKLQASDWITIRKDAEYDILFYNSSKKAIDELHKFSDGTLDDVRTALNDRLKGIRMEYMPQTFWSQRDKANARAMIQAIDKRLKTILLV